MLIKGTGIETLIDQKTSGKGAQAPASSDRGADLQRLYSMSGHQILEKILALDTPGEFVRQLSHDDFFWLIKKIGDEDSLPLLELASHDQWHHLLDLELWKRDRIDLEQAFLWLGRLHRADPGRLAGWLFGEGQLLMSYCLFKKIRVDVRDPDEVYDLRDGFFTLDGVYYINVPDEGLRQTIEGIIRSLAEQDINRYHALVSGLAGLLPAETEEELYRLRSVRLAEHGFLPFEEAVSIYARLEENALHPGEKRTPSCETWEEKTDAPAPVLPLYHARGRDMLTMVISGIKDDILLNRIELEFAGLCNQILSADGSILSEFSILLRTCRKAAGYLNLALENLCGEDISLAGRILKENPLASVFRVGFGMALELKWEAERWWKGSWFHRQGLAPDFWGDEWGESLKGILQKRPLFYTGGEGEESFRGFERLSELDAARKILHRLRVLDSLFEGITGLHPPDHGILKDPEITFQPIIFTIWARRILDMKPHLSTIPGHRVRELFRRLRAGETAPPYGMPGFKDLFINEMVTYVSDPDARENALLRDTLALLWQEFVEEYRWVSTENMEMRYMKFLLAADYGAPKRLD